MLNSYLAEGTIFAIYKFSSLFLLKFLLPAEIFSSFLTRSKKGRLKACRQVLTCYSW